MSNDKPKTGGQPAKPVEQEQAYPLEDILANAPALFGVKAEVVAGALYENTKEELTVNEVRQAVSSFMKRRAK